MQFFQQQQVQAAQPPVQLPQAGNKRKRDEMMDGDADFEMRPSSKRVELESHQQQQGSQSPVLSVASVSSPVHIDLNMAMIPDDDEPCIRRFQNSPSQSMPYDPWASMRIPRGIPRSMLM